jgi:uncharacterized protein (DUF2147 family)
MQRLILLMLCGIWGIGTFGQNINDKILGQWTNVDQNRVLEFVKNGSVYDAIINEADPPSFIGQKQITSLEHAEENDYRDGTLHIFQKDRTAKCLLKLLSENQLELKVSMGLISKSAVWTRVSQKI